MQSSGEGRHQRKSEPIAPRMRINRDQLKVARILVGWGQRKMADQVGVSAQSISNAESGRTNIGPELLQTMASVLERAGVDFLNGDDGYGVYFNTSTAAPDPAMTTLQDSIAKDRLQEEGD